jgi:outer membrane protein assembly factor BamE (lipoprotein component of BamABCDE complex)
VLGRVNEGNSVRFERLDEIRVGTTTKAQVRVLYYGFRRDTPAPK